MAEHRVARPHTRPLAKARPIRLVAAVAAVLTSMAAGVGTARAGSGWQDVSLPASMVSSDLGGVAAAGPSAAWAVGSQAATIGIPQTQPLAMSFDGQAWRSDPLPNPGPNASLEKVAAASPAEAWALGTRGNLPWLLHWSGSAWSEVAIPNGTDPALEVLGVAAAGHHVWLITYRNGVAHILGGTAGRFRTEHAPIPAGVQLTSISAASPSDAWAVGSGAATTVVVRWDGRTWRAVPVNPSSALVTAPQWSVVSAGSATSVWIAGSGSLLNQLVSVAAHWNGSTWTESLPGVEAGFLLNISGDGSGGAWIPTATDSPAQSRYLHFDGTAWAAVYGPARAGATSVSAQATALIPGTTQSWGVGDVFAADNTFTAIAERFIP
jgi:hypothetical protein